MKIFRGRVWSQPSLECVDLCLEGPGMGTDLELTPSVRD